MSNKIVNVNGVSITYQADGDPAATPVLLIMGLGMQLTAWPVEFVRGLVGQGYYVIRFDNRDSGLSSKMDHLGAPNLILAFAKLLLRLPLGAGYKLADMADDTLGLLDVLGIEKAHVIGVSMGGMIAQILAGKRPERVLTLTSVMSTSGRRGLPGPSVAARRVLMIRPKNPKDPEQLLAHMLHTFRVIGSPAYPTPEPVLREMIVASLKRSSDNGNGVVRQMVAIAASGDRVELLKKIRSPTLVIHGAEDPLVPLACGRDTAHWIPGAILRVIDGMGHDLATELNATILEMIGAHCQGREVPESSWQQ